MASPNCLEAVRPSAAETEAAARARSPIVAALPEDEIRRTRQAVIGRRRGALIAGGDAVSEDDLRAAERLGADRARQGVPVAALLDGFQAGRALIVRTVVEQGRAPGCPPTTCWTA